jgi:hypothetical protein
MMMPDHFEIATAQTGPATAPGQSNFVSDGRARVEKIAEPV